MALSELDVTLNTLHRQVDANPVPPEYYEPIKTIVLESQRLWTDWQFAQDLELAIWAWAEILIGVVPANRIVECFDHVRLLADGEERRLPINLPEILTAWREIKSEVVS